MLNKVGTSSANIAYFRGKSLCCCEGLKSHIYNTVFAKATSAQYADLAEWYEADADYPPGTVLIFGGRSRSYPGHWHKRCACGRGSINKPGTHHELRTQSTTHSRTGLDRSCANLVVGPVAKGDMMVTAGGGRAQACTEPRMGSVIGKALQDHPGGQGTIEIVVGRM
jgi:hypothetical protein